MGTGDANRSRAERFDVGMARGSKWITNGRPGSPTSMSSSVAWHRRTPESNVPTGDCGPIYARFPDNHRPSKPWGPATTRRPPVITLNRERVRSTLQDWTFSATN